MRKRTKDFEGCIECRARKVKCDKAQPSCMRCLRIGKKCSGYIFDLVWVPPNHEISKAQGRGGPCAYTTWHGWPTLNVAELERLLLQLDESLPRIDTGNHTSDRLFSVFEVQSTHPRSKVRAEAGALPKPTLPPLGPEWNQASRFLFHHYVNHVAALMMPLHDSHNPWTTDYPRLALENQCVRDAILGQAAAHLYHKTELSDMKIRSLTHRVSALRHLQSMLHHEACGSFVIKIAAILSLIMADVYFGLSDGWKSHITGAIEIAISSAPESPWLITEMGWLTAQSLSLICLRAKIDGSFNKAEGVGPPSDLELPPSLLVPVSRHPHYGFTMGASQELAASLADCAAIVAEMKTHTLTDSLRSRIADLMQRLLSMTLSNLELADMDNETTTVSSVHKLHIHIFALGLLIRLQRSTINPKPSELLNYTSLLFKGVVAFQERANITSNIQQEFCSPTIWPVFHAAVELYRSEDQQNVRQIWLNDIEKTAIGNRKHVRSVLEKIWLIRNEQAHATAKRVCTELYTPDLEEFCAGEIVLDWIEVAKDMGLDLLLV